jgi:hypothetical protein
VRARSVLCVFAATALLAVTAQHAIAADAKREAVVLQIIKKVRKGVELKVPTFTQAEGSTTSVPANMKVVRKSMQRCVDKDPFIADLLDSEEGFFETAIDMNCEGTEDRYGAIFKFTASGELVEATFRPGGINFAPPPLDYTPKGKSN